MKITQFSQVRYKQKTLVNTPKATIVAVPNGETTINLRGEQHDYEIIVDRKNAERLIQQLRKAMRGISSRDQT